MRPGGCLNNRFNEGQEDVMHDSVPGRNDRHRHNLIDA